MASNGLGRGEHLLWWGCLHIVFTFSMLQIRPIPAPGGEINAEVLSLSDAHISLPACDRFQRRLWGCVLLQVSPGTTQPVSALASVVLAQPTCIPPGSG